MQQNLQQQTQPEITSPPELIDKIEEKFSADIDFADPNFWHELRQRYPDFRLIIEKLEFLITGKNHLSQDSYKYLDLEIAPSFFPTSDTETELVKRMLNNIIFLRTNGVGNSIYIGSKTLYLFEEITDTLKELGMSTRITLKKLCKLVLEGRLTLNTETPAEG